MLISSKLSVLNQFPEAFIAVEAYPSSSSNATREVFIKLLPLTDIVDPEADEFTIIESLIVSVVS